MKVFVFACLLAIAMAKPVADERYADELSSSEEIEPIPYQFNLEVADDEFTNYQSRVESQDENGVVQGQYSFVGPNGIRYTTTYTADAVNGFQAHTEEEQTNIEIVFPTRADSHESYEN